MANTQGVLRIVALDSAHKDPDFFQYPDDIPGQANEPVWGVWEHVPGDDEEGIEDTWAELSSGLTVREAQNAR